jgi:hypothetical protein
MEGFFVGKNELGPDHVCDQHSGHPPNTAWQEVYQGCAHAEWQKFENLAIEIMQVQMKNQKAASSGGAPRAIDRAFHAKPTLSVDDAVLRFLDALPAELQFGNFASPGGAHRTKVRFSNANGRRLPDNEKDMRGVALRVTDSADKQHDLLLTNSPASHARDGRQFVKFAKATAGGKSSQVLGLVKLAGDVGVAETVRMLKNVRKARRTVPSIATETYWSRGAIRWGDRLAVRYVLKPARDTEPPGPMDTANADFLFDEVSKRLERGPVRFVLNVQKFVNEDVTPIEDTSVEWTTDVSPLIPVAELIIPQRAERMWPSQFLSINFNPWNTTDEFRPLGNLNRARKVTYDASADVRNELRWRSDPPLRNVVLGAGARSFFRVVNRFRPWYRLGVKLGLINIVALRQTLQRENRIDTEPIEAPPTVREVPKPPPDAARVARMPDGEYNDLSVRRMGAVQASFGRNLRPEFDPGTLYTPNVVEISDRLLARQGFRPATSLNILAAGWIQFQIHDWVNHDRFPLGGDTDVIVPLPPGADQWDSRGDGNKENVMRIAGNRPRDANVAGSPLGNNTTFWGDASELYGTKEETANRLRDGAELSLPGGYLPLGAAGVPETGFTEAWWLGLSALHTLFAREHNVVCAELRDRYPEMTQDQRYHTARLIVSALITKIHTLEWTPAILARKTIEIGMNANWSGPADWLTKVATWLIDDHASKGIPATFPDHRGVPFSLTEDFTAVYRFHPLLPDDYCLRDHTTNKLLAEYNFQAISGIGTEPVMQQWEIANVLYSFGIAHPGAITLHNFPSALRHFERAGEAGTEIIDLAVVDLIRTRARGVPRYNDFRAGLHLPRFKNWADLTSDPGDVWLLKEIYGSIDQVDTMIGLFAETPPEGFGFSDTAFRIFISTATNRIQSDRFLTVDFRPEIYTPFGMDWISNNTMRTVILRHCPELAAVVPRENAFTPWRPADTW